MQEDGHHRLSSNPYPGRGIILGLDETGRYALQLYWITARSAGSKNRVLVVDGKDIRTQPFDEEGRTDDPNIYYRAIASTGGLHVVSNGSHTDSIVAALATGSGFAEAVRGFSFETDAPNFTPRIAGVTDLGKRRPVVYLGNAVRGRTVGTLHGVWCFTNLRPGAGYCLHTYSRDGDPLPSFTERPYEFALVGTPEEAAARVWELLAPDKRVALALKVLDVATGDVVILLVRNTLE
jgi:IMP cyclohydrolase